MERQHIAILEYFDDFPDSGQLGKALYPLPEIILTSLCAVICGADSFVEKASMRARRKRAGWDDGFLASALAANPAI